MAFYTCPMALRVAELYLVIFPDSFFYLQYA